MHDAQVLAARLADRLTKEAARCHATGRTLDRLADAIRTENTGVLAQHLLDHEQEGRRLFPLSSYETQRILDIVRFLWLDADDA